MRITIADRIQEYLDDNPGAHTVDIAKALGISRQHASNTLRKMARRGQVRSRLVDANRPNHLMSHYLTGTFCKAPYIAVRGRSYQSPFGVLMAQVIHKGKTKHERT